MIYLHRIEFINHGRRGREPLSQINKYLGTIFFFLLHARIINKTIKIQFHDIITLLLLL